MICFQFTGPGDCSVVQQQQEAIKARDKVIATLQEQLAQLKATNASNLQRGINFQHKLRTVIWELEKMEAALHLEVPRPLTPGLIKVYEKLQAAVIAAKEEGE